jgi:release factor glutamine methyltransferase
MSEEVWTVRRLIGWTTQHFEKSSVDAPRLTAEILLGYSLKMDRVTLYTQLDRPLNGGELSSYRELIQQRAKGEPTQYLTGFKEFYGRRFQVDRRVLIPRSETELLVEAVLTKLPNDAPSRVLDVCTGSGCIAITIAAERPLSSVWATDISPGACEVARQNAESLKLGGRVTIIEGDLLQPVPTDARFDVIVSNPPYVRAGDIPTLQREVQREPVLALNGGDDGFALIGKIADTAQAALKPGGLLAMEIGDDQGGAVKEILTRAGYRDVRIEKDLARLDRLALALAI